MNILIVENDLLVANFMRRLLLHIPAVHIIAIAQDFSGGFTHAQSGTFDLILIDIMLGNGEWDGIDLCTVIRKSNADVPIIIVTCCHDITFLEKAFAAGANDYITKPFLPKELELRVKRWHFLSPKREFLPKISYKSLTYDAQKNDFFYGDTLIKLSKKQKKILLVLIQNSEQVVSARYLEEKLWEEKNKVFANHNLRSNMYSLRSALRKVCGDWIQTKHGEGYVLLKK